VRSPRGPIRYCAAATLAAALLARAQDAPQPEAEELVFLAQHIGSDYADREAYAEVQALSQRFLERLDELNPESPMRPEIARLASLIRDRAPAVAVSSLCTALVPRLVAELRLDPYPFDVPDLVRGRALYRADCASCHGASGAGDGPASPGMSPPPTSFRAPRMRRVSPYEIFTATSFGVPGTAMPSHREGRSRQSLWDVAFFVMTLREGFDPVTPPETVPVTVADLASMSNDALLQRLRRSRPGASVSEVDFYRAGRTALREEEPPPRADGSSDPSLAAAEDLERAFARAADRIVPSVVGISVYEKATTPSTKAPGKWVEGDAEENLYPGFRRARAGSGFVVSDEGYVLTAVDVLGEKPPVIDVEIVGNVHARARLVGMEPSIRLAVLKIDPPVPLKAATLGDSESARVGQWAAIHPARAGRSRRERSRRSRSATATRSTAGARSSSPPRRSRRPATADRW
jgi:mono/diheme cytochrome c family protein